jgi:hypothetical protein
MDRGRGRGKEKGDSPSVRMDRGRGRGKEEKGDSPSVRMDRGRGRGKEEEEECDSSIQPPSVRMEKASAVGLHKMMSDSLPRLASCTAPLGLPSFSFVSRRDKVYSNYLAELKSVCESMGGTHRSMEGPLGHGDLKTQF